MKEPRDAITLPGSAKIQGVGEEAAAGEEEPADFEKAIDGAGFGAFNFILLLVGVAATFSNAFETTTTSYILPVAEMDLQLTLFDKGALNAATYAGMIVSAILWGYLADTQGRRKILIYGYLADVVCVLGSSLSQNMEMLATFKFLGGFVANGPGAVLYTYITELHGIKYRTRVLMIMGMSTSLASVVLPLIAWAIFPRDWNFVLFDYLNVHSWQIFLLVCAVPSLLSGLAFIFLPESPKFLMSQGRNGDALQAFQTIYTFNKRRPKHEYPIRQLIEEVPEKEQRVQPVIFTVDGATTQVMKRKHRSFAEALSDGMLQMKPMFRKPLLGQSLHVYIMQGCILMGLSTVRLWLPQLFASMAEYEGLHHGADDSSNMCSILEYSVNRTAAMVLEHHNATSEARMVSIDMYTNNIIVATSSVVGYFIAAIIARYVGANRMLTMSLFVSGCCGIGLYWSRNSLTTLIISSLYVAIGSISASSLVGVVFGLFPTTMRSLVTASALMFGRFGALSGNLLFPIFMKWGCIPPFLMVGLVMFCADALSCILPSQKKFSFA